MKPISLDVAWHIFNHSEPYVQSRFTRCSRAWHSFFNPKLYRQDVRTGQYSAVFRTISNCTDTRVALATLRHASQAGADYNKPATMFVIEAQQPSPFLVTALYVAASKGYADIVSFLLDHGADIDGVPDCRLRTPLFISLLSRDAETSMLLLRRGARLESPEFGINALHQAAAAGLTEVITYLIEEKGLEMERVDSNGDTPLIHSLLSPSPETVITHLARFNVDVNQPTTIDTWRMTALSMACEDGMFSAALALLQAGADATGESDGLVEGADPALLIFEQKPLELALLARAKQTDGRTAVVKQRLIDYLLKSGADPNATVCISARCNWTGPLLLKLIRMRRRWEAEMLLSSGLLDVDKRDSNGATSLSWTLSTCHGNPLMASILLRRGAKMDDTVLCSILSKLARLADARDDWIVISLLTREPKLLKIFHVVYSHCFWVASQRDDAAASRFLQDSPQLVGLAEVVLTWQTGIAKAIGESPMREIIVSDSAFSSRDLECFSGTGSPTSLQDMEPTPDQIFPSLDHSTAQLFGASFLNQDELDELERVSMVASRGGRKRARFVSCKLSPC
ncbi:hypothetical protein CKAH01_10264 [Colletotrichum kahawae]|uniref:Ankyrin repeat protein n=1 Tax=Colletotrichum kahawae TaxID=34407 RepID=A0AAE0CXH2_COLKA|nr:hypothetical protein CKAH01_10264 [Colletotrichum kahawae]